MMRSLQAVGVARFTRPCSVGDILFSLPDSQLLVRLRERYSLGIPELPTFDLVLNLDLSLISSER